MHAVSVSGSCTRFACVQQQVSSWRPELMEIEDQAKQVIFLSAVECAASRPPVLVGCDWEIFCFCWCRFLFHGFTGSASDCLL